MALLSRSRHPRTHHSPSGRQWRLLVRECCYDNCELHHSFYLICANPASQFNTSQLGLAEYSVSNSALHATIASFLPVPPLLNTTASLTQYIGIKDWYSMHYLSICSGFFAPSTSNKVNISCTHHMSGYTFNLQDTLRSELYPSVISLADDITPRTFYTTPWIALWYIGLICAVLELGLLLWTWTGKRRLNGFGSLLALVPMSEFFA